MGLLVLVAGGSLLMFGMGSLDGKTAHLVAGSALVLAGLGKLLHAGNMCPSCKGK